MTNPSLPHHLLRARVHRHDQVTVFIDHIEPLTIQRELQRHRTQIVRLIADIDGRPCCSMGSIGHGALPKRSHAQHAKPGDQTSHTLATVPALRTMLKVWFHRVAFTFGWTMFNPVLRGSVTFRI